MRAHTLNSHNLSGCLYPHSSLSFRAHLKSVLSSLSPHPSLPHPSSVLALWSERRGRIWLEAAVTTLLPPHSRSLVHVNFSGPKSLTQSLTVLSRKSRAFLSHFLPPCRRCARPSAPPRYSCAQGRLESEKCTRHVVASPPSNHPSLLPIKPQLAHPGPWLACVGGGGPLSLALSLSQLPP